MEATEHDITFLFSVGLCLRFGSRSKSRSAICVSKKLASKTSPFVKQDCVCIYREIHMHVYESRQAFIETSSAKPYMKMHIIVPPSSQNIHMFACMNLSQVH